MAFNSLFAALILSLAGTGAADCQSYGEDYENGGSYYQNSNLNQTFTAYQQFDGCNNDTSHNVLVDPNGGQTECSQTPMLPSNTSQTVTCDAWNNSNMYTGDWSILVISNNQNGSAIAFQRDFHLDVSPPNATVSAQASITTTVSAIATSVLTVTSLVTASSDLIGNSTQATSSGASISDSMSGSASLTGPASSTPYPMSNATSSILPSSTGNPGSNSTTETFGFQFTFTTPTISTPSVSFIRPTITIPGMDSSEEAATVTSFSSVTRTTTVTGSECPESAITDGPSRTHKPDSIGKIVPSILGALDAMAASIISKAEEAASSVEAAANQARSTPPPTPMLMSAKFKRAILEDREPSEEIRAAFVRERAAMLHGRIAKRHPDNFTTTVTTGTFTHSTTVYVSTAVNTTTVYSTTTEVGLFGRDAQSTVTTVMPTTIYETVTETPSSCSSGESFF